jgi:hypothetical protein
VAIESLPQADAIVVLAGAIAAQPRPDGSVHMFAGGVGDRFETGVAAFQAGRALYTSDEASNVAAELQKLGERGAKTIILCISAWHLPRAGARSGASTRWPRSGWGCPPGGDWLHRDSRDADTLTSNACARPSSTSSPARARTS